ncbi:hypothetical protein ABW21_db0201906 [Orbilia brochopaga]|nr:hypothetical protein ABW21_db0201906 [Drechslerella brochopaga]
MVSLGRSAFPSALCLEFARSQLVSLWLISGLRLLAVSEEARWPAAAMLSLTCVMHSPVESVGEPLPGQRTVQMFAEGYMHGLSTSCILNVMYDTCKCTLELLALEESRKRNPSTC